MLRLSHAIRLFVGALLVSTVAGATQITQSSLTIGGPGSCGSEGYNDPGLLNDGLTPASATYDFTLNAGTNTLTVVVTNTSPVSVGVNNPLLLGVYFNTPSQVTNMMLTSQTSSAGVNPSYSLSFDADLATAPNPNGANGFGAFNVLLEDGGDVGGSIANAAADTYVKPQAQLAVGPVTFVLSLTGNLAGVSASDFSGAFSTTPPGNKPSHGSGKFQSGGVAEASAFISDAPEDCFLLRSSSTGSTVWVGPDPVNYGFVTQLGSIGAYQGVTMEAPFRVRLPKYRKRNKTRTLTPQVLERFRAQVLMHNTVVFPSNPYQYSRVLDVTIYSDGTYRVRKSGTSNNITASTKVVKLSDGRRFLEIPFTIGGF
jgi:hypothetical protein